MTNSKIANAIKKAKKVGYISNYELSGLTLSDILKIKEELESTDVDMQIYFADYAWQDGVSGDSVYVEASVINPEYNQQVIEGLVAEKDVDYEEANIQLTLTSQYHNWSNTIADNIYDVCKEYQEKMDEFRNGDLECEPTFYLFDIFIDDVKEYNKQVSNFNKYGDRESLCNCMTVEEVLDVL